MEDERARGVAACPPSRERLGNGLRDRESPPHLRRTAGRCPATATSRPWCRLRLLRQIRVEQFLFVDDGVAVEDRPAFVPGQEYGDPLGHAGADQSAGGGAGGNRGGSGSARRPPVGVAELSQGWPLGAERARGRCRRGGCTGRAGVVRGHGMGPSCVAAAGGRPSGHPRGPRSRPPQQQPTVPARRQARSAHDLRVEPAAQAFDERIDGVRVEQRSQPRVERRAGRLRQFRGRDPQRRLLAFSNTPRHARQCRTRDRPCRSPRPPSTCDGSTFTTGYYTLRGQYITSTMTKTRAPRNRMLTWFAFMLAFSVSLAFCYATYDPIPPRVNVRWSEDVTPRQRVALEAAYRLAQPEYADGTTCGRTVSSILRRATFSGWCRTRQSMTPT